MLPWFSMSFNVLCCCLHIWRSSYLFPYLLIGFRKEVLSTVLLGILSFSSDFFYRYICSTLWGKVFKIVCLLLILKRKDRVLISFCLLFLRQCCVLKFVYFFPILQIWDSFLYMLNTHLQRLALTVLGNVHKKLAIECVCVCVSEAHRVLEILIGQLVESSARHPLWLMGRLTEKVHNVAGMIHMTLIYSKSSVAAVLPASSCLQIV